MCEYCSTDREGYVLFLPRKGVGNARIQAGPFYTPSIEVSGPNHTRFSIEIEFCPKCGRDLRRKT